MTMKFSKLIIAITLATLATPLVAQQQVMFTQYMFNQLAINPAYAGSHRTMSFTALARKQWAGIDGAPSTQTLSMHTPTRNQRVGIGLLLLHDKIGVTKQTGVYNSYSYTIPFYNGGRLAMGLQAGFTTYNAQYSLISDTDPAFATGDIKETHPNIGAGVFYYTNKFYVGFSVPQLLQNRFDRKNPDSDSRIVRHYFLSSGYVFTLDRQLKLKPSVLVKGVAGAPIQVDLNLNLLMNEIMWVGLSWRSFESLDALLQFQVTKQLQVGYAYDFSTTSELSRINSGSHELMVNYRVIEKRSRKKQPRYF
ncbi:MAG: type IX secretion system membrane protein PorP/SprF [Bacteroidia bacterium]|nr:type IX secretion system membrane protein PorP/SprF [Bacteroidia bacterium]